MTDYEKFILDLKGFIVIPEALTQNEIDAVSAHINAYSNDPESIPEEIHSPIV